VLDKRLDRRPVERERLEVTAGERERATPRPAGNAGSIAERSGASSIAPTAPASAAGERPETAGIIAVSAAGAWSRIAAGTANATTSASQRGQDMFGTTTVTGMNVAVGRTVGELVIACGPSVQSRGGEVVRLPANAN